MGGVTDAVRGRSKIETYLKYVELLEGFGETFQDRDRLGDWLGAARASGEGLPTQGERFVSNIVVMGMGEPLYNFGLPGA